MQDIRDTLLNITKNVTKTSGDLLKTTKLSMNLSGEETNLRNLYLEIGKKVHEIYQYGGGLGKFFDEKYLEIEACERKIAELKEQISQIKGTRICAKCGKTVERAAEFCPKCGLRLEAMHSVAENPAETLPESPQAIPAAPKFEQTVTEHPIPPPIPESPQNLSPPPEPVVEKKRICRICNGENDFSTKFCLFCGRILD